MIMILLPVIANKYSHCSRLFQ